MKNLLTLQNITVAYNRLPVLDAVSLSFSKGDCVALLGPNGAGKSTVLKTIFGLVPMRSGHMEWMSKRIVPTPHKMAKLGIALVPQGRRVFRTLTIEENLEVGGFILENNDIIQRRIRQVFNLFPNLEKKRDKKAGILSGGEQQMLALARALIMEPILLLLDEPTLGLSPKVVKEVFQKIEEINKKFGTTILIVEHNLKSVLNIVDRGYILDKGIIVEENSTKNLLKSQRFQKILLGS